MTDISQGIEDMNEQAHSLQDNDAGALNFDVSDAALEIAASAIPGGALSFPNAPTVSVLVVCCSQD